MPTYCALPPLDQAATRIGRGYGLGYNRARTAADQLHGGMDFVADAGTPVVAVIPGTVSLVSRDARPARGMAGYGNAVVLQHDFALPGLPNPFWTSYNHLRDAPQLEVGQRVAVGQLVGLVGQTTNGQFRGMGPHLHFEVRRRPFPGSYDRDTVDPGILFAALGIDHVGARREVQRLVGGQLLVRASGPSDCRAGQRSELAGGDLRAWLGSAPTGYVDPSALRTKYTTFGTSRSNQNIESPALQPPDYAEMLARNTNRPSGGSETVSSGVLIVGGVAAAGALLWLGRR